MIEYSYRGVTMKFLRAIKKTMLVVSATYITIGVLVLIYKETSNQQVFEILAIGLGAAGILSVIKYFMIDIRERIKRNDFIIGILLISIAAIIYLSTKDISYMVSKIIAIAMIISGFAKIEDMFDAIAIGRHGFAIYLCGFMICAGLGTFVLLDIISSNDVLYLIIGIGMCFCGISDLVSNIYIAASLAGYEKHLEEKEKAQEEMIEENQEEQIAEAIEEVKEEEQEEVKSDPEAPLE